MILFSLRYKENSLYVPFYSSTSTVLPPSSTKYLNFKVFWKKWILHFTRTICLKNPCNEILLSQTVISAWVPNKQAKPASLWIRTSLKHCEVDELSRIFLAWIRIRLRLSKCSDPNPTFQNDFWLLVTAVSYPDLVFFV